MLFLGILSLSYYLSEPVLNTDTEYVEFGNFEKNGCDFLLRSRGVDVYFLQSVSNIVSVDKPSKVNDLLHSDINWPWFNLADTPWEEDSFILKFLNINESSKVNLQMFGSTDGVQASMSINEYKNLVSMLIDTDGFMILTGNRKTKTGSREDTLGIWQLLGNESQKFKSDLMECMKRVDNL